MYLPARHDRQPDDLTHDKNSNRRHSELPSMSRPPPVYRVSLCRAGRFKIWAYFTPVYHPSNIQVFDMDASTNELLISAVEKRPPFYDKNKTCDLYSNKWTCLLLTLEGQWYPLIIVIRMTRILQFLPIDWPLWYDSSFSRSFIHITVANLLVNTA